MYGVEFVIFYYPIISMVDEFWVARRGMAYGILCSASGVSGIVMPFSLEELLNKCGLSITLRAVAIGLAVLTGPLLFFIKGRVPTSQRSVFGPTNWAFLRAPLFWVYTTSNLMQGLGYFFPSLYLPAYASTIGLSPRIGALLLAIMSVSQVFGQLSFGYLSDRQFSVNVLTLTSTVVSATAVLSLWGLARNFTLLCIFTIIYGFFAAGYTAMWARMGTAVTTDSTSTLTAFGLFNFGKGLGNVLAGPISANILRDPVHILKYMLVKYEAIVLFTSSCMFASAVVSVLVYYKDWKYMLHKVNFSVNYLPHINHININIFLCSNFSLPAK
jgi:predicted MFS family arabinose efflux permease